MKQENHKQLIIPFGKYEGQPLEAIKNDAGYLKWLMTKDWFRSKYGDLYQIIINNFQAPDDTPEHNAMHVKFTDSKYRDEFVKKIIGNNILNFDGIIPGKNELDVFTFHDIKFEEHGWDVVFRLEFSNSSELILQKQSNFYPENDETAYYCNSNKFDLVMQYGINNFEVAHYEEYENAKGHRRRFCFPEIYENGHWHKKINPNYIEIKKKPGEHDSVFASYSRTAQAVFYVEIKPTISDDFPSVMRMIKSLKRHRTSFVILLVGEYTGIGATKEQFEEFFKSQNIHVVYQ
jgi:uncharacterized protein (DUF3820 family)